MDYPKLPANVPSLLFQTGSSPKPTRQSNLKTARFRVNLSGFKDGLRAAGKMREPLDQNMNPLPITWSGSVSLPRIARGRAKRCQQFALELAYVCVRQVISPKVGETAAVMMRAEAVRFEKVASSLANSLPVTPRTTIYKGKRAQ